MDDLILAGALAIITLYAAAMAVVGGAVAVALEISGSILAGNTGRAMVLLAGVILVAVLYGAAGLWLRGTGRT